MEQVTRSIGKADVPKSSVTNSRVESLNYIHDVMQKKLLRQFRVNLFYKNALRFPAWGLQAHEIEVLHKSFVDAVDADLREYKAMLFSNFHITERLEELPSKLVRVEGPGWRPSGCAADDFRARSICAKREYLERLTAAANEANEDLKREKVRRESAAHSLVVAIERQEEERAAIERLNVEISNVTAVCESRRDEVVHASKKREDVVEIQRNFDETDFRKFQN